MLTCPNCGSANPETAKFCSNCGKPVEKPRSVEGERKFATVLFADVARSTAMAEQLDPEDWAVIMNGAFSFMNAAVARYGGTVSRLMGDAVLALFGAPIAHEDDAERAVRAGLDIQTAAMAYAAGIKERHGFDFELRVGINTGTAVLAFVGDQVKTEYTAMGDAANVAARLQSAASPGTVLISADTYRLVHALFDFMPRRSIEVKGKQTPLETYEVIGAKAVAGNLRGLAGLTSRMVGREREIEVLTTRLAALRHGQGAVVTLLGEAGLGKSRLIAELRKVRDAEADAPIEWFETRAISYGQSIPYYPWRQLGRQIVGSMEGEPAQAMREKLDGVIARLGVAESNVPFLQTMLAIDTEESRVALSNLAGEAVVNGVAAAVVNVIKAAVHRPDGARPHVIVLDDLHWSDSASLELVAQVATLAAFEPLLVICVMRQDRKAASWQLVDRLQASLGSAFDRIDLEPLPREASRELLGNLLHIEDLPESIRAQILERSEGNPFYLEEVLRSLIDDGQVVREDDHWRATRDIIDAKIPETLAGVLSARIDRLPEATKRVAQTAAVIGRVFQHRVLEFVCRDAPGLERIEHVEPHIAALSYEQLVRERARDPEREYIFKHALTCDAAYGLLLKSRRRDLHARTGAALEALFADRRDEYAAMLAWHFAEADDPKRALTYSKRAAANAKRLYALQEELMHRERILACLDQIADITPAAKIDAIIDWATVRHRLANFEGVLERLAAAVELARQSQDKQRLAASLSWTANIHFITGFPSRSVPYLIESQQLGHELGDERVLLLPLFFGIWSVVDRDPASAVDQLEEVIGLARKNNVTDVLGHAMAYRAVAFARIGNYPAAHMEIQRALDLLPHTFTPVKRADIHIGVGMAYNDMGEFDKSLEHSRIGAELAEAANGFECACAGYFGVGRAQLDGRNLDAAKFEFERSLGFANAIGFEVFLPLIRGSAALTEFERGSLAAVSELRSAVETARATNDNYAAAQMAEELAGALIRLGRHAEAAPELEASIEHYRMAGMHPYLARALKLKSRLLGATGRGAEAAEALAEAVRIEAAMTERNIAQSMEKGLMEKPVIFAVDDDAGVLSAVVRDLRKRYATDYDIQRASSGAEALAMLRDLKLRNRPVALLLVDQRMPEMTGVDLLRETIPTFADTKRVLLTAYADTEAAIKAINEVRLDHYLMKPWHPPEELLYPVLDDLLSDWRANYEPLFEGVRIIGHRWSSDGHRIRDFLARNLIPYRWLDIETDPGAGELRALAGMADAPLPVVALPDGTAMSMPSIADLAARLGLHTEAQLPNYDLIVVGTGPAGLAAAVYGASEGLRTVLIEREAPGGQAGTSARIENYLGFPVGLSGSDLARRAVAQARRFGVEILSPMEAVKLVSENGYHRVTLSNGSVLVTQALIIATGVSYRMLDAPGAERLAGAGVFYGAAITEALSVKDQDVLIVGGGNSAGQAAMYLGKYAKSVTILVRGNTLVGSMSRYLSERIDQAENVNFRMNAAIKELHGETTLEEVSIIDTVTGDVERVPAKAVFCFIGAAPRTDWLAGTVELDPDGYILSGPALTVDKAKRPPGWLVPRDPAWLETNIAGVFVVGDVRKTSVKRMASAIGEGAMSITFVHQHLRSPEIATRPPLPQET